MIEIRESGKIIEAIIFDRQEVGTSFVKQYEILNKSVWPVTIIIEKKDEDIEIRYPSIMKGNETGTIIIEFNPKITRRTPLKDDIVINGVELIG